jgi:hypothetical protein
LTHVEERIGVKRTDRIAVGALHIIAVNAEFRLGEDFGAVFQKKRIMALSGIDTGNARTYLYQSLEHAATAPAGHTAHDLVCTRIGRKMSNTGRQISVCARPHEIDAGEIDAGAAALDHDFGFQPRESSTFGKDKLPECRVLREPDAREHDRDADAGLQDEPRKRRIRADIELQSFGGESPRLYVIEHCLKLPGSDLDPAHSAEGFRETLDNVGAVRGHAHVFPADRRTQI